MAFVAEGDAPAIPMLQAECRRLGLPLLGAVLPELLGDNHFHRQGMVAIFFSRMPRHLLLDGLNSDGVALDQAMTKIAGLSIAGEQGTLFLVFDGMLPNIASCLEGLYRNISEQINFTGISAGSETFKPMPCLFSGQRQVGNGVLALFLHHDPGAVLEHGYQVPEKMVMATAAQGNCITSIDWRPAFDVYRQSVLENYGVTITAENFYQYGAHFPFGLIRADGIPLVRIPVALAEDGSLFCVGEIPENSVLALLHAVSAGSSDTVQAMVHKASFLVSDPLCCFYCAGRRMHLGVSEAEREVSQLAAALDRRLIGGLSLGEIGSIRQGGYPLFHNAAIVCSSLGNVDD